MRIRSTVALLLLCGCSGLALSEKKPVASRPPNIIIIQADDLGYGDLSSYGEARYRTPALDTLASQGMRFTQYYAGSAVCAPSRTSLMTGLHTGHAWIRTNGEFPLRDQDVTLAEVLKQVGYRTAIVGKWGLGVPGSSGEPNKQGFDYAYGFLDHRHAHRQYTEHLWRNGQRIAVDPDMDYVNDLFSNEAMEFVRREKSGPFMLYLNYTVPHAELRAPEDAVAPFRGKFPEKPFSNPKADATPVLPEGVTNGYRSQAEPSATRTGMIVRMDRDIGRLVALLRTLGIDRNTIVMFISDNGPSAEGGQDIVYFKSSGGLRGKKRQLYEGGIRVPMIVSWPGTIPANRTSDYVWAHWDLLPTLAQIAGAQPPSGLDGISVRSVLLGKKAPARPPLYWEFQEDGFSQAVRFDQWKAIRPNGKDVIELYDLVADPTESRDLAPTHPAIVERARALMRAERNDNAHWPEGGSKAPGAINKLSLNPSPLIQDKAFCTSRADASKG